MVKKNMAIAMILSFIWSGLGLIYADELKMGIILVVLTVIFEIMSKFFNNLAGIVVFILWAYSMYATYTQVNAVNRQ